MFLVFTRLNDMLLEMHFYIWQLLRVILTLDNLNRSFSLFILNRSSCMRKEYERLRSLYLKHFFSLQSYVQSLFLVLYEIIL